MILEYVPLLQIQRDLYQLPRGFERFREYLKTMIDPDTGDIKLPLSGMNPMGKEHLPAFLDRLIDINADLEGARATDAAARRFGAETGRYKVCVVVTDDRMGGWTNRYANEFAQRFQSKAIQRRGWISGILWTSESYTPAAICEEIVSCVSRTVHIQRHGYPETLRQMLIQEGFASTISGSAQPSLELDDRMYTQEVLQPLLQCTDTPTLMAALFGDPAAHQLGYPPLGLSLRAGLAIAESFYKASCKANPYRESDSRILPG